jgi:hypothetical protein
MRMKKGNNTPFVAAILVAACWACVSAFQSTQIFAQSDGIDYAVYGDANLDGVVSGDDFTILTGDLGKFTAWETGDFNYNGIVAGDDFTLLVQNLGNAINGANLVVPAADLAAIDAFAAANGLQADVPEPASMGLLAIGTLGVLSRRRSRV